MRSRSLPLFLLLSVVFVQVTQIQFCTIVHRSPTMKITGLYAKRVTTSNIASDTNTFEKGLSLRSYLPTFALALRRIRVINDATTLLAIPTDIFSFFALTMCVTSSGTEPQRDAAPTNAALFGAKSLIRWRRPDTACPESECPGIRAAATPCVHAECQHPSFA